MPNVQAATGAPSIEDALRHHQEGRLAEAEAIYRRILANAPRRPDVLHFLGVIALQRGNPDAAVNLILQALHQSPDDTAALNHLGEAYRALRQLDAAAGCFREALARNPTFAEAHNGLGIVLQEQGRLSDAIVAFRRAVSEWPGWGAAQFNLGLTLKRQGDADAAAEAFAKGWLCDPACLEAAGQCIATVAELARRSTVSLPLMKPSGGSAPFVSVVFCSIDDGKCARATKLYEDLLSRVPHEIIAIRNARSLAEAYNRAIVRCRGDIVVLSHDDIDILSTDFAERLARYLQQFDAIGVVGGTTMSGSAWKCSGHPNLRGWITHRVSPLGKYVVGALHPSPVSEGLITLDGVFLAARREIFKAIPFDEGMFDGFHLYDIDWSYRAAQAGFRLGTAGDLLIVHESRGEFGATMQKYGERFCFKHQVEARMAGPSMIFEAEVDDAQEVRQFFARLSALTSPAE